MIAVQPVVVDTSVIIKWLNQEDEALLEAADKLLAEALHGKVTLLAPELAKYEVANVLLKGKKLSSTQAKIVLNFFYHLPIVFMEDTEQLSTETFKLATNLDITYYDASFLAVAKQQNGLLVTDNFKHQGTTKSVSVMALKDYGAV